MNQILIRKNIIANHFAMFSPIKELMNRSESKSMNSVNKKMLKSISKTGPIVNPIFAGTFID